MSNFQATLDAYVQHVEERANLPYAFECAGQGIDPKPIQDAATAEAVLAVLNGGHEYTGDKTTEFWLTTFENEIFPATEAATVKANALQAAANGEGAAIHGYTPIGAVEALGRMRGGQAIIALTNLLSSSNEEVAQCAANQLKGMALAYHSWEDVYNLSESNKYAKEVVDSWAAAEWFTNGSDVPDSLDVVVFLVEEGNTEPLSPATQAHTREDLSYHSLAWMKKVDPNAIKNLLALKAENPGKIVLPVFTKKAFAGSSRATGAWNTVRWFGAKKPSLPGFWWGGLVAAPVIDAKGYNALLGIETIPVQIGDGYKNLQTGQHVTVNLKDGKIEADGNAVAEFGLSKVERITYKAGGSSNFLSGRLLTAAIRSKLGLSEYDWGIPGVVKTENGKYTALQKLFGNKIGSDEGVAPGSSGLFDVDLMASQDTTGTITRLALRLLTCEKFVPPVLQTLCHTSAHPKPSDVVNFETLPKFFKDREGIGLLRGDGVIHSWLKKMSALGWLIVIGDSHGRNVFGAAVPGDSLLVATAGAFGKIPYTIPKSIRVEFKGDWRKVKPRDIQLALIENLLSQDQVDQYDEKNILNGKFIEIYGLDEMDSEQKFEIMNAMGEYGPASQFMYTPTEVAVKEVQEFVAFWKGYKGTERGDVGIQKLVDRLEAWLENPVNPVEDEGAEYDFTLEVNLDRPEPLVTLPGVTRAGKPGNSYLNVRRLSEVPEKVSNPAHLEVEEGMVLSCVSRTQHFTDSMVTVMGYIEKNKTVGGDRLWYSAPTVDIEKEIREMGLVDKLRESVESAGLVFWDFLKDPYANRQAANFRWEMPGCSLCMGNQETINVEEAKLINGVEKVRDIRVVWGSNTRNNDGRVGPKGETFSFICDPFLATCAFLLRKPPTVDEYYELEALRDESKSKYLSA